MKFRRTPASVGRAAQVERAWQAVARYGLHMRIHRGQPPRKFARPFVRHARWVLVGVLFFLWTALDLAKAPHAIASEGRGSATEGELALQSRLLAPCCWKQTLDVHESELSTTLRDEIHRRLLEGEPPGAIEESLVQRFGEKIRAVPKGGDFRDVIPLFVGGAMVLSAIGIFFLVRRWRRRSEREERAAAEDALPDVYDARLDDALRQFGD